MSTATPYVSKIFIYPIKSLDRLQCDRVTILQSGALQYDRTFAIFDQVDNFVNGKRNSKIHSLRSQFQLETNTLSLQIQGTNDTEEFNLIRDLEALNNWLGKYFGFPVKIKQNLELGFPDDTVSPGPTIISTATLKAIASWYTDTELSVEDIRLRFRANIEISGVPAFWEDRLFAATDETVDFQIGDVQFMGVNPCQRCVVVTRNSSTGYAYPKFQKTFITKRQETLPEWTERSRFNHFFRLAVNTKLSASEAGKVIQVGDRVVY
jgi:uncharacterized protein